MIWTWLAFIAFVLVALAFDLGVFHRKSKVQTARDALVWTVVWIGLGVAFTGVIYLGYEQHWLGMGLGIDAVDGAANSGRTAAGKYLSGYLLEKSLSIDNLFVIAMIFQAFAIPLAKQHRILFWGVVGALVLRGALIGLGAELIARYSWVEWALGALVLVTALRMFVSSLKKTPAHETQDTLIIRLARRFVTVSDGEAQDVPMRRGRRWFISSAALALIAVEATDVVFALDSIPAIFAVTADAFIVFSSNIFAMLGLRSLYFVMAGMLHRFIYLNVALSIVLAIVGGKLLAGHWLHAWAGSAVNFYLLGVVGIILGTAIIASLVATRTSALQLTPEPGA